MFYSFNNSLICQFIHSQVYLKFSKSEIAKTDVIKQMFVVNNVYNSAIKGTGPQNNNFFIIPYIIGHMYEKLYIF